MKFRSREQRTTVSTISQRPSDCQHRRSVGTTNSLLAAEGSHMVLQVVYPVVRNNQTISTDHKVQICVSQHSASLTLQCRAGCRVQEIYICIQTVSRRGTAVLASATSWSWTRTELACGTASPDIGFTSVTLLLDCCIADAVVPYLSVLRRTRDRKAPITVRSRIT